MVFGLQVKRGKESGFRYFTVLNCGSIGCPAREMNPGESRNQTWDGFGRKPVEGVGLMKQRTRTFLVARGGLALALLVLAFETPLPAQQSLHQQIDALLQAGRQEQGALSTDAEFLRRISLDLVGQIPTAEEVRTFLEDKSADKRVQRIDQLLADRRYARAMREKFHVMLMERRGDDPEWQAFLRDAFTQNRSWTSMVRSMLNPDEKAEQTRGSAFFLTKRLEKYGQNPTDYPGLTRDIGRLFLGVDLQCAQCHDHLFIDDYKQLDFQGMYAFTLNTFIRGDTKFPAIGEKVMKKPLEFQSVFIQEKKMTGPRLVGRDAVEIATFEKDQEFAQPPDKKTGFPGKPKFSPLSFLAEQMTTQDNERFSRNIANRIWYLMLGKGLVYPLDLHHGDNPPTHPELLSLLARQFAEHDFDIKWLIREIALSESYQRSGVLVGAGKITGKRAYEIFAEKPLSSEQLCWSMLRATGELSLLKESGDNLKKDSDGDAAEAAEPQTVEQQLEAIHEKFRVAYANPPREPEGEFAPSVRAALFVLNNDTVLEWLKPRDGNLVDRLVGLESPAELAQLLYLSVLSRLPTDAEQAEVKQYLGNMALNLDRPTRVGQLVWALLASTEFNVNH
jgi:hypothetical protein